MNQQATSPPRSSTTSDQHGVFGLRAIAAYVTWAAVSADPMIALASGRLSPTPLHLLGTAGIVGMLVLFVATILRTHEGRNLDTALTYAMVLGQGVAALVAIALLPHRGTIPVLLVIVSAELAMMYPLRRALPGIVAMTIALAAILLWRWEVGDALQAILAYAGFQAFAAMTGYYSQQTERARDELAQVNAHLLATRELLEESTRSAERLKLSRELHDVAGHKLTALKLNLARAVRDPALAPREDLAIVGQLADELLGDIRAVVSELRRHDGVDLGKALLALTRYVQTPVVHVEIDPGTRVDDVQAAETLLRCAQEALTNAVRHSQAADVWLTLKREGDRVRLQVRDNGRGAERMQYGNGLNGMRERLSALGGTLSVDGAAGRGVSLACELPLAGAA